MITAITSIIIFSLVILIHEMGHFLAARKADIDVSEFSVGMGPVLFKKKGKRETTYFIKALPIGGYIKMEGEDEDSFSEKSFNAKSPFKRFMVIFMGPVMNFALAIGLFFIIVLAYGIGGTEVEFVAEDSQEYASGLRPGDQILAINDRRVRYWEDLTNEITQHEQNYTMTVNRDGETIHLSMTQNYRYIVGISPIEVDGEFTTQMANVNFQFPADLAGIRVGDTIKKINGSPMTSWDQIRDTIGQSNGKTLLFEVDREGAILEIEVQPDRQISLGFYTALDKSIWTAITGSVHRTIFYVRLMFQLIFMMISGQVGSEAIAGPVGIISMVGEAARIGWYPLLNLAAFISINLGFFNLLPIPALDGSRLIFIAIEGIRGKRIPPEKEGYIHFVGFMLLMGLMFFVLYQDIIRLLSRG